jgi:hypothetical protein
MSVVPVTSLGTTRKPNKNSTGRQPGGRPTTTRAAGRRGSSLLNAATAGARLTTTTEMPMPSEIVEAVKESQWMKDGVEATTYWVTLVDGVGQREIPCYDPRGKDLKEDAPLPEGWEVKTSKAGKPYLAAPRQSSGGGGGGLGRSGISTAWRNTEAGAKYEQERMDRRTALMQAVALGSGITTELADKLYVWLRTSVDGGGEQSHSPTHREAASPSSTKRTANEPPPGWNQ